MNLFNPQKSIRFPADDPRLVRALQRESRALLAKNNDHRYADARTVGKALALLALCLLCYGVALIQQHLLSFFVWYLLMIVCAMLLAVNVMHDASHNAFLRGRSANRWLNRLITVPLGMDPDCWRVRHVRFHHSYTHIECYDPDTAENGLLRQSPWQHWRPMMQAQRYYWPLVAALTFPWYIWVMDWLDRGGLTPVTPHLEKRGFAGWWVFLCGKGAHIAFSLLLPCWVMADSFSAGTVAGVYLASQMTSSLFFVMLVIGTHWAKGHAQLPPENGKMSEGRLAHVFTTTFDWSTRPAWLGYWLGGLNLHLTHHLFPHWNHRHYHDLSQVIEAIAREEGLDYQRLSLRDLLKLQQRFLTRMGEKPEA